MIAALILQAALVTIQPVDQIHALQGWASDIQTQYPKLGPDVQNYWNAYELKITSAAGVVQVSPPSALGMIQDAGVLLGCVWNKVNRVAIPAKDPCKTLVAK